jgi:hypothetical protein
MNSVVHFELPAGDKKRMSDFYTNVFGWKTQQLGPEMGDYVIAHTTETSDDGMPKNPGAINGGFFTKSDEPGMNSVNIVINVEDINEHIKKVQAAGGTVQGDVMPIPGIGLYAAFVDTEGNRIGMLQPQGM